MVRISMLAVAAMTLGGTVGAWAGAKPDPTPDWRCQVVFRDASGDKIESDGLGTYRDGVGGVTCYVINEPGATQDRWLFMSITGTKRQPATRVVKYIGQSNDLGQSYANFDNNGTFEVMGLAKVGWNSNGPSARDVMPFRAYLRRTETASPLPGLPFVDGLATVAGDSNLIGSFTTADPTSSVFVQPIDACTWQVTSYTTEEPGLLYTSSAREQADTATNPRVMRITEGAFDLVHHATLRGDFQMPFEATIRIIANKPGCSQP